MASEFYKISGGDECLLVGPGQAHCRKLNITSASLGMRVGFMLSFCKTDDKDNALTSAQSDSIALGSPHLGLLIGLRNYGNSLINATGQYFFGAGISTVTISGNGSDLFSAALPTYLYENGVRLENYDGAGCNLSVTTGTHCTYLGMKLRYASQQRSRLSVMKGTTNDAPTEANLRTLMMNHVETTTMGFLNDSSNLFPYLNSIYIQNPFVNCYIRVHAYGYMLDV